MSSAPPLETPQTPPKPETPQTPPKTQTQTPPACHSHLTRRRIVFASVAVMFVIAIIFVVIASILFATVNQSSQPSSNPLPPVSTSLSAPATLPTGGMLMSPNAVYGAFLDSGNFYLSVLGTGTGQLLWAANFVSDVTQIKTLSLDSSGLITIYQGTPEDGVAVWTNGYLSGQSGAYTLRVTNSGQLQEVDSNGVVVWNVDQNTPSGGQGKNTLTGGFEFPLGGLSASAPSTSFAATFDVNTGVLQLTSAASAGVPLWQSSASTAGTPPFTCYLTPYGNLLIWDSTRQAVWSARCANLLQPFLTSASGSGTSMYTLVLNPGNARLEIQYGLQATVIWASGSGTNMLYPISNNKPLSVSTTYSTAPETWTQDFAGSNHLDAQGDGNLVLYCPGAAFGIPGFQAGSVFTFDGKPGSATCGQIVLGSPTPGAAPIWVSPSPVITNTEQLPLDLCFASTASSTSSTVSSSSSPSSVSSTAGVTASTSSPCLYLSMVTWNGALTWQTADLTTTLAP